MKRVAAAEANRNFSRLMREAEAGETIVVMSHDQPRVVISSARKGLASQAEVAQRKAAWRALKDRVDAQPAQSIQWKFDRDQLYEDPE
jgi:prevent-host-death family protein